MKPPHDTPPRTSPLSPLSPWERAGGHFSISAFQRFSISAFQRFSIFSLLAALAALGSLSAIEPEGLAPAPDCAALMRGAELAAGLDAQLASLYAGCARAAELRALQKRLRAQGDTPELKAALAQALSEPACRQAR